MLAPMKTLLTKPKPQNQIQAKENEVKGFVVDMTWENLKLKNSSKKISWNSFDQDAVARMPRQLVHAQSMSLVVLVSGSERRGIILRVLNYSS